MLATKFGKEDVARFDESSYLRGSPDNASCRLKSINEVYVSSELLQHASTYAVRLTSNKPRARNLEVRLMLSIVNQRHPLDVETAPPHNFPIKC